MLQAGEHANPSPVLIITLDCFCFALYHATLNLHVVSSSMLVAQE
jgi:hypothetical protein